MHTQTHIHTQTPAEIAKHPSALPTRSNMQITHTHMRTHTLTLTHTHTHTHTHTRNNCKASKCAALSNCGWAMLHATKHANDTHTFTHTHTHTHTHTQNTYLQGPQYVQMRRPSDWAMLHMTEHESGGCAQPHLVCTLNDLHGNDDVHSQRLCALGNNDCVHLATTIVCALNDLRGNDDVHSQ